MCRYVILKILAEVDDHRFCINARMAAPLTTLVQSSEEEKVKKRVVAILLSLVMAAGSVGPAPVRAAEAVAA